MGSAVSTEGAAADGEALTKDAARGLVPRGRWTAAFERRFDDGGVVPRGEAEAAWRAAEHSICVADCELGPTVTLQALNHSTLQADKLRLHMTGTREWVFAAFDAWLAKDAASTDKLFWLMGGGGTGKSVAFSVLLDRQRRRGAAIAWHLCRHDDAAASKPATIIRSLAAMLCETVPGFEAQLRAKFPGIVEEGGDLDDMQPADLFAVLVCGPLSEVEAPGHNCVIGIDALDELPREHLKTMLALVADSFPNLPDWVKVFVTSRDEAQIKAALSKVFSPMELKVDGSRNQEDVRAYLRSIARDNVDNELSLEDVERDVEKAFPGLAMRGKLAPLAAPLLASKEAYDGAMAEIVLQPRYGDLLSEIKEMRPAPLHQTSADLDALFVEAARAQTVVTAAIADEWDADAGARHIRHPTESAKQAWVDSADDPGTKGMPRALEKVANDYGGDFQRLTDISRISLRFSCCERLLQGFRHLQETSRWVLLQVKNRFASPTPLGYRDINACFAVPIADGTVHIVEVQLNIYDILRAKSIAHAHYEAVRSKLPELCAGTAHSAGALEAFIMKRLDNSALDAVVDVLAAKSDGLFIYARLLEDHLAQAGAARTYAALEGLPAGLDEIYEANFRRCFDDEAKWKRCAGVVAMIVAAREPLRVGIARDVMGTAAFDEVAADLSILFPIADGRLRVLHKSVTDWLQLPARAGKSFYLGPAEVTAAHARLARALEGALSLDGASELATYAVAQVVYHQVRAASADEAAESFESLRLTLRDAGFCARRVTLGQRAGLAEDYANAIARAPAAAARVLKEWSKFVRLYAPFIAKCPHLASSYARNFGHASTSCVAEDAAAAAAAAAPSATHWVFANAPTAADALMTKMASGGQGAAASLRHDVTCVAAGSLAIFKISTGEPVHGVSVDEPATAVALADGEDALDAWFGAAGSVYRCDALEGTCDKGAALRVVDGDTEEDGGQSCEEDDEDGGGGQTCVVFVGVAGGMVVAGMGSKKGAISWNGHSYAGSAAAFFFDDAGTGRPQGAPTSVVRWSTGEPTWAYALVGAKGGAGVLVSTHAKSLKVWDAATGSLAYAVATGSPGFCAAAHPTEDRFLSGHGDHVIREWRVGCDAPIRTIQDTTSSGWAFGGNWAVAYSGAGAVISTEPQSKSLRVWDANGAVSAELKGHRECITAIHAVRGADDLILSCDRGSDTLMWELPRPGAGPAADPAVPEAGEPRLADFSDGAWCGFAGDDTIVVVDSKFRGGGVFAFSSAGPAFRHLWTQPCAGLDLGRNSVGAVFTAAGDARPTIAVSGEMGVALLDSATGALKGDAIVLLDDDDGSLTDIAVNAAGILVGVECRNMHSNKSICVSWDCAARTQLATYKHHGARVFACDVSAAGLAVTAGHSDETHVWDARTGISVFKIPAHGMFRALWLDDSHVLLDAETAGSVALIDIADGAARVFEIHRDGTRLGGLGLITTDGLRLLAAGEDHLVGALQ